MKRPNTNINITFYLKKTTKISERRGIYANITLSSTQRQASTKIYANHPDHFQRGGNYDQGTPLGHWQSFYEHGGLWWEGTLVLGLESEMWQYFDDLGHIQYLGAFDHGK